MVSAFSINDLLFNNVSETKYYKYKLLRPFTKMQFENENDHPKKYSQTIN